MIRIFSVEDNMLNINLIRRYFKHADVLLIEAETGEEALKLAEKNFADIILLDYHLPDMTGRELAKQLRQIAHLKDVPMVALTADDTGILRKQMMSEGFAEVLYKPLNTNQFLDTIEQLLHYKIRDIA